MDRLRFGGYVQGRFEYHADSRRGVNEAGKPAQTTQFLVRRARLRATYTEQVAELMLQVEAAGKTPSLKDAEATLIEPWTGIGMRLSVGQLKVPFGYEVLQSSVDRDMPERTRLARALFPGERDRGVRLQIEPEFLRFSAAVLNGNGIDDPIYSVNDQNLAKDVSARVGVDAGRFVGGISGYFGREIVTTLGDGDADPPTPTRYKGHARTRYGADAQVYLDVPSVGGLAIKGEAVLGRQRGARPFGFYFSALQAIGTSVGVFARFDGYDPDTETRGDRIDTVGGGAHYLFSGNLKLSAVYEHPMLQRDDTDDDIGTLQLQAMF
jgi:hypothetical protein